jgi:hypothetical protein
MISSERKEVKVANYDGLNDVKFKHQDVAEVGCGVQPHGSYRTNLRLKK